MNLPRMTLARRVALPLGAVLPLVLLLTVAQSAPKAISFRESVEPIFKAECTGCHAGDNVSGGLALDTVAGLRKGGVKFGSKGIVPGDPKKSALVGYLRGQHQPQMPMGMPPLSEGKIRTIEAWIAQGARVDAPKVGWPYTPLSRVSPPSSKTVLAPNPIDRFLLSRLAARKLSFSTPAPKTVLLRRVYFDVIGLPPTPAEADRFLSDTSPDAYPKLVDRLLSDPRYGERWARHWLDLVRYAETHGFEGDGARPRAWRYRDYVIQAFNEDKGYFRFLQEQIAGDEMWPDDPSVQVATGFLRLGVYNEIIADAEQRRQDVLNDTTDAVSATVLGMTVGCARCHDHKYDRITQRDYYRLQAFFTNTRWTDQRITTVADTPATVARRKTAQEDIARAEAAFQKFRKETQGAMGKSDADDNAVREWLNDPARKSQREQWERLSHARDAAYRDLAPVDDLADAISEAGADVPMQAVLLRGNLATPGEKVRPGMVAAFTGGAERDVVTAKVAGGKGSGARTALANWVASPTNPMPARVMVNRLWQHHFGVGLVATPSDFGRNGARPTHPELLDWLAGELIRQKGSLKAMHRLMLTSQAYRQSVAPQAAGQKADPQNRLLWRQNRQRLEGEAIRDSILAVSGGLNPEQGGPSVYPEVSQEVLSTGSTHKWGFSSPEQQRRRSIYVFQRRSLALPLVEAFDGPDMVNPCPRRNTTTIAPQALAMFNGSFGWTEARRMADRLAATGGTSGARITEAYRLAFARRPSAREQAAVQNFLARKRKIHAQRGADAADQAAWTDFCHVLFNTNEFVYVD